MYRSIVLAFILFVAASFGAYAVEFDSYNQFCATNPLLCKEDKDTIVASPAVSLQHIGLETLKRVNAKWNRAIVGKKDSCDVVASKPAQPCDIWSPPSATGDCEEFAIAKKLELLEYGLYASQLLLTVVKDAYGDGHLVLVVRTNGGNYVLDNLRLEVLLWEEAGYPHYAHQRPDRPVFWTYESF